MKKFNVTKINERGSWNKKLIPILAIGFVLVIISLGVFRNMMNERYPWIWAYIADQISPSKEHVKVGPTHVMFFFTDHFEPHDQAAMDRWVEGYPKLAEKHRDADGKYPQHSWFWYFDKSDDPEKLRFLKQLAELTYRGFGEMELHLHHYNDNEESFLKKMGRALQLSQQTGALITKETHPRTTFGFIHGRWSLDNSRGPGDCGVNNELILLRRLGCYADFTHPSWGKMHPKVVNRIYYATDDPLKPKSYDRGKEMRVGAPGIGDLLIFEGPSVVRFKGFKPIYDHGEISADELPMPERIDGWVKANVHVKGRPEWVFVKVFAHGALHGDSGAVLGAQAEQMYAYLEQHYNDGKRYVLHYVTAREAYNIAIAAEAGKTGNPNDFRDFTMAPYVNRFMTSSLPYEVISIDDKKAVVKFLAPAGSEAEVRLRAQSVSISGGADLKNLKEEKDETVLKLILKDKGIIGLTFESYGTQSAKEAGKIQ